MAINYNGSCRVMVPLLTIMTTVAYYTACLTVKNCIRKEGCLSPGFTAAQIKHLSCQDIWEGTNTNFKYGKLDVLQTCVNVTSNKLSGKSICFFYMLCMMKLFLYSNGEKWCFGVELFNLISHFAFLVVHFCGSSFRQFHSAKWSKILL